MSGVLADYIDKLKYKDKILLLEINKGEGLNTRVYEIEDTEIYRFVFKDNPQKNHIPPYEHTPKRSLKGNNQKIEIGGYGLSCLETQEAAEKFYAYLEGHCRNMHKIGDSIAKGEIVKNDGVISDADNFKHFDLFEYQNCDLGCKFVIVKQMI